MFSKPSDRTFLLIGLLLLLGILYLLRPVLLPFLISFVMAYLADPVTDKLERLVRYRTLAVTFVFIGLFVFAAVAIAFLIPVLTEQINSAISRLPNLAIWFDEKISPHLDSVGFNSHELFSLDVLNSSLLDNWPGIASSFRVFLLKIANSSFQFIGAFFYLLLIPVVTFYLLRDWDRMMNNVSYLIPSRFKPTFFALVKKIDIVLSEFFRGQLAVMVCLILIYSLGLLIVGLELWFLAASLAGLFSFIPYVGIIVGILFSLVGAIIQMAEPSVYLGIVLVFLIGQILESIFLSPLLVGDRVGLHPVLIIFAIMAGGELFGFFGVLAAVPLAAIGVVLIRHFLENSKFVNEN